MLNLASFNFKPVKDKELWDRTVALRIVTSLECSICKTKTRSVTLKRHCLTKHTIFSFEVTTVVRGFLKDKYGEPSSIQHLLDSEILVNKKLLNKKIKLSDLKNANGDKHKRRIKL